MAGPVSFGSFMLHALPTYRVLLGLPKRAIGPEVTSIPLAALPGSVTAQRRHPQRQIEIPGAVHGSSDSDLQDKKDALLLAVSNGIQNLKVGYPDERYYRAELLGEIQDGRLDVPFTWFYLATFVVVDPFAYANAASTPVVDNNALSNVSGSLYRKTLTPTAGGTIFSMPKFTIGVPGGGPYGMTAITVRNVTTGEVITVARTYSASETLIIDCELQEVTVDGAAVDYFGTFPSLDPRVGATNSIQIDAVATSTPTLNVTLEATKRYV